MSKEQAEQATAIGALSSHQEVTSSQLMGLQTTMDQVLKALSKEPSGESLEATLKSALQPLQSSLDVLIKSFNKLADYSQELSARLPQQPKQ